MPGSDTGDYVVRNLVGIDPRAKRVAIGEAVEPGDQVVFCRRDTAAAREDLARMLESLKEAAPRPRGALYFSCVARGEHYVRSGFGQSQRDGAADAAARAGDECDFSVE